MENPRTARKDLEAKSSLPKNFAETYPELKKSVVAIVSRLSRNRYFPTIIGTGFIVRGDGFVLTCKHVLDAIHRLPRRKDAPLDQWPVLVMYFHWIEDQGMVLAPLEILGAANISLKDPGVYFGDETPDLAVFRIEATGLPAINLDDRRDYTEGREIFFSGFPMGIRTLLAPGWVHQVSPTLQRGIISAVLPFPCDNPHAILIEGVTEGGSSGSPVFDARDGRVVGMIYAGIPDEYAIQGELGALAYAVPTAHTLVVPNWILHAIASRIDEVEGFKDGPKQRPFNEMLSEVKKRGGPLMHMPKQPAPSMAPALEHEIVYPRTKPESDGKTGRLQETDLGQD